MQNDRARTNGPGVLVDGNDPFVLRPRLRAVHVVRAGVRHGEPFSGSDRAAGRSGRERRARTDGLRTTLRLLSPPAGLASVLRARRPRPARRSRGRADRRAHGSRGASDPPHDRTDLHGVLGIPADTRLCRRRPSVCCVRGPGPRSPGHRAWAGPIGSGRRSARSSSGSIPLDGPPSPPKHVNPRDVGAAER
jgi:hypothetical protein